MRLVECNYIQHIFPFVFNSKFLIKNFNQQPIIKNLEISLTLNKKYKPEILFWILFLLNKKKNFVQFIYKKKYFSGKSIFTKSFLNISKKFGSKKNIIYFINNMFQNLVINSKEVNFMPTYPYRSDSNVKVFKFYEVKFEEKYNGLINLAPKSWIYYNLKFLIKPKYYNGFHFRFFLQNLQLPVT